MVHTAALLLVFLAYLAFAGKRLMTYMHVLQQEEYDNKRLKAWIFKNKVIDKRLSFALLVTGVSWFFIPEFFINFLVFMFFVIIAYLEKDPRKNSKKKLVATDRAKRIFFPTYAALALCSTWFFATSMPWLWIFSVQLIPVALIVMNNILKPFEDVIQHGYWLEAQKKMQDLRPTIIGITGSFGKTSVKHMLGHILKTQAPTIVTPGSVNTPMGITRIIREELEEKHRFFVVEMGAYGPGSIDRLCKLTPPDFGVITSIGHAHYERFKSLETVSRAKYELAQAVIKRDGKVIVHERTLRFPYPRDIKAENFDNFIVCGEPLSQDMVKRKDVSYLDEDDLHIQSIEQKHRGLEVLITWNGETYNLEVPVFGIHHGHNAALAFATAVAIGIKAEDAITALKSVPQIEHRLELKKQADGSLLIDDAYNSNPIGFRCALDFLAHLGKKGRKILVTPGMVELGVAHGEAHETIGKYAGEICDIAIVVTPKRIPTFIKGFQSSGNGKQLIEVETFEEASAWLESNRTSNDIVLLENDLPDMYERIPKI